MAKDYPILFSAPMVGALIGGQKTQTRRLLKEQVPYSVGQKLWVREGWRTWVEHDDLSPSLMPATAKIEYLADLDRKWLDLEGRKRASMHMPRWASRVTLVVTDVRAQPLQDITEQDAKDEGLSTVSKDGKTWKWGIPDADGLPGNDNTGWHWHEWTVSARDAYAKLWDSLNAKRGYGWSANPSVIALTFEVHHCNIDQMEP